MANFIELLKATRVYRTLQILMSIMLPAAFANAVNKGIIFLIISCVLIYSTAGIDNAIRDKDYILPKYSKKMMLILLFIGIAISFSNRIIFFTAIISIFLGLTYNTVARFILFGDSTILAITHYTLPCLSSSLLLKLNLKFAFILAGFMFITFWFIMQSKNLKDTKDDAERGYKTLTAVFKNGKIISIMLLIIGFLSMFSAYFLFDLTSKFLMIFSFVFIIQIIAINRIINNRNQSAVKLIRLLMMLFLLGIIADRASAIEVIVISLSIFLSYLTLLLTNLISKEKYNKININAIGG